MKARIVVCCSVIASLLAPWVPVEAAARVSKVPQPQLPDIEQTVVFYDALDFKQKGSFTFAAPKQGLSMALTDFGLDGKDELVVGSGKGEAPEVLFLRTDGSELKRLSVYTHYYRGGVNVAVGDIDGNGSKEVITGTRDGGGPHVRIFLFSGELASEWFAYPASTRTGVSIAAGDVNKQYDGDEVITAPGEGEPALLRVFTSRGQLLNEWYPFGEDYIGGLNISVTPNGWILASRAFGASPMVRAYDAAGSLQSEFLAYFEQFAGGVQSVSFMHGWQSVVLTVPGMTGGPHVRAFSLDGSPLNPGFMALDGKVKAGLTMAAGDVDGDGRTDIAVAVREIPQGPTNAVKTIFIDLSEQRLWTYERGKMVKTYLISSGTAKFPTPTGDYSVSLKREKTRMSWFYGPDNPDNYDLKDVPWVLTFKAPFNIHGAYWHNNFGQRMSHGCVNMSVSDSKEVYEWADVGTAVFIQQ